MIIKTIKKVRKLRILIKKTLIFINPCYNIKGRLLIGDQMERLQKVIAQSGLTSRRKAEDLIQSGRVRVNDEIVTTLGFKVNSKDKIYVDNQLLDKEELVYFVLNKPEGYLSTAKDDKGRKTVIDLLSPEDKKYRVYPVGRLDYDSRGLIILTNDGDLTNKLINPKFEIEKEYLVRIKGIITENDINKIKKGVIIDENYLTKPCDCYLISKDKKNNSSLVNITITEGKNHQVKKMFDSINYPVKHLTRVRIGFLTIKDIGRGFYRPLKIHEIKKLKNL